jgi:hypothetical protein
MARNTRPGSIQAAVRQSIKGAGGLECASDDLGVSVSTLSLGSDIDDNRPGGLGVNYLDRLSRIDAKAALPLAQHFSQLAGGVFQPLMLDGAMAADINQITREFSDVLAKHAEAHSSSSANPESYTPAEARAQIVELDELMAAAASFRARLMQDFGGTP